MELRATLPNHIPACRSELKLLIMKSFSFVETVKEASAVCRSFLDGVVIFLRNVHYSRYSKRDIFHIKN